jgi:uncharacterized membrane protein YhaH (DUF805 family)
MGFGEACSSLKRHLLHDTFKGRASRSEYWYGWLLMVIITAVITPIYDLVNATGLKPLMLAVGLVLAILAVTLFVEELGLRTRRAHDANMSGWWVVASVFLSMIVVPSILYGMYQVVFLGSQPAAALGAFLLAGVSSIVSFILWILVALAKPDHRGAKYDKNVSDVEE